MNCKNWWLSFVDKYHKEKLRPLSLVVDKNKVNKEVKEVDKVANVFKVAKVVRSLQKISENLSGNLKIENSFFWANAES
jgi:hypothetical protein